MDPRKEASAKPLENHRNMNEQSLKSRRPSHNSTIAIKYIGSAQGPKVRKLIEQGLEPGHASGLLKMRKAGICIGLYRAGCEQQGTVGGCGSRSDIFSGVGELKQQPREDSGGACDKLLSAISVELRNTSIEEVLRITYCLVRNDSEHLIE
jgi:hypothetical protein